jgi:phosphohistidine swiveling domain-containing protein
MAGRRVHEPVRSRWLVSHSGAVAEEDGSLDCLSWEWKEECCPWAVTPLAGDFLLATNESVNRLYERAGVRFRWECRIVGGYAYTAPRLLVPEAELPSVLARMKEMALGVLPPPTEESAAQTEGELEGQAMEALSTSRLAELWDEVWQGLSTLGAQAAAIDRSLTVSLEQLVELCGGLWPSASAVVAMTLVQGQPSRLHRLQRDLYRLAASARSLPAVAALIVSRPDDALVELGSVDGGPEFLAAMREFLVAHGHLGPPFCDLAAPTWAEDPVRVLHEVQRRLLQPTADPETLRHRLEADSEAQAETMRGDLSDRPQVRRRFDEVLAAARLAAPQLEAQHDALEQQGLVPVRRLALQVGRRLVDAGVLLAAADVFFLSADEVGRALRGPADLRPLVSQRRSDHERFTALRPPRYLGRDAAAFAAAEGPAAPPGPGSAASVLRGTAVGGGRARGPARIVESEADFPRLQKGDILVCATTAPSWVPLFDCIAGLVTNTGGLLCHAAILAREFGVPAVVGTREATRWLHDGELIEVDGGSGAVRAIGDDYRYQTVS